MVCLVLNARATSRHVVLTAQRLIAEHDQPTPPAVDLVALLFDALERERDRRHAALRSA